MHRAAPMQNYLAPNVSVHKLRIFGCIQTHTKLWVQLRVWFAVLGVRKCCPKEQASQSGSCGFHHKLVWVLVTLKYVRLNTEQHKFLFLFVYFHQKLPQDIFPYDFLRYSQTTLWSIQNRYYFSVDLETHRDYVLCFCILLSSKSLLLVNDTAPV